MKFQKKITEIIKWLLGAVAAALIAMVLGWVPNPFLPGDCVVGNESYNFKSAKVRLYHSRDKQGLAAAFEKKLNSCGVNVEVADNSYSTKRANIRYYSEGDSLSADAIKEILNSVVAEYPSMNVRFEVNSRLESKKYRKNIFHAYF